MNPPISSLLFCLLIVGGCLASRHHHHVSDSDELEAKQQRRDAIAARETRRNQQQSLDRLMRFKVSHEAEALSGQELVDYANRHQSLWTSSLNNKFSNYNERVKYGMMGVDHVRHSVKAMKRLGKSRFLDIDLPTNFDAREQWPSCDSIKAIRDQSACGSCWAFGAVEAMSDRICIASGGKIQVTLSADDLLSCCTACGFGCDGGEPVAAWDYWVSDGLVTGSNFSLHEGCRPYPFPACEHHSNKTHYPACKHSLYPTPSCDKNCQSGYDKTYSQDKHYGKKAYAVEPDVKSIQKELYTNGPLEVSFEVYEDFLTYQGGIYIHQGGKLGGGHAVKLIGWGEEGGVPYWTVANSWNTDWGENGFFRIIRGKDECGIESGAVGGIPDLSRSVNFNDDREEDGLLQRSHHHRSHRYN